MELKRCLVGFLVLGMLMSVFSGIVSATENITISGGGVEGGSGPLITVSTTTAGIESPTVTSEIIVSGLGSTDRLAVPSISTEFHTDAVITRDSDSSISLSRTASVDTVMRAIKIAQDSQVSMRLCLVDAKLMKELNLLMRELKEAEDRNDEKLISLLYEKIRAIKEKIREDEKDCQESQMVETTRVMLGTPLISAGRMCVQTEKLREKKKHYESLYLLSEEELENRGYNRGKEEIKRTIEKLEEEIRKGEECEAEMSGSGAGGMVIPVGRVEARSVASTERPVAVSRGEEITGYYNVKVSGIMTKEMKTEERIAELKGLRDEIDKLIEELIKSKDEIRTDEMSGLVEEIRVKPNEIRADDVVVSTVNKRVMARVNERNITIMPVRTHVIIQDMNIEVKVHELKIKNNVLRVGNSEVKLMASEVVERIKVEPKEVELVEENDRAVYKIRTEERRKLIGLIPVMVRKNMTVDAAGAEVLEEKKPWWGFMTVKSTK